MSRLKKVARSILALLSLLSLLLVSATAWSAAVLTYSGSLVESLDNDGTITGAIAISLTEDTFQDADADNLLDVGTEVTIVNVPAGLTAVMTLSNTDTTVTLTFTGTATNHQDVNDVSDLIFVFANTAFTNGDASLVNNSGASGAFSSNVGIDFEENFYSLNYQGPGAFDVSTGVFVDSFSVAAQESTPQAMAFNNDGTKLYLIGSAGDDVNEYDLSTAYNVSTGVFNDTFSVAAQESAPTGMTFNNDGTKLYVIGITGDDINEYNLSPAYDVSSGVFVDRFSVAGQETVPFGMAFNNTGTKLYVIGIAGDDINEYNLSPAYDVSTGVFVDSFSVAAQDIVPTGMAFNNDGTKLYVIGQTSNNVNEYNLSPAYDVSTGVFVGSFSVAAQETNPTGMAFNNDGNKLYVLGNNSDNVNEYSINPGSYVEAAANNGAMDTANPLVINFDGGTFQDADADNLLDVGTEVTIGNVPAGLTPVMTLSNTDTTVTLTFIGTATNHQDVNDVNDVNDVSDLTFVFANTAFTNGDAPLVINSGASGAFSSNVGIDFQDNFYSLSYLAPGLYDVSTAVFVDSFSVIGQDTSASGMAFNNNGTKLYVLGNSGNDINEYNLSPAYDVSSGVFVDTFSVAAQDNNPHGMAFNNDGTKLYVIGNSGDNIIEYNLSSAYDVSTGVFVDSFSVVAQDTVPTGMAFNNDGTKLYVVGDTGNDINEYNLSLAYDVSTGVFVDTSSVATQENFPQGMAFNSDGTKLYMLGFINVNEYSIKLGNYIEAAANNGAMDTAKPLVINFDGDTFQDTDADNLLDVGTEVIIGNVPAGLTAVMTLSNTDTTVTLTFTGTATNHQDVNDVSDLTFVFANLAFTNGDAPLVINSGASGAFSSNVGIDFQDDFYQLNYPTPGQAFDVSTSVFVDSFSVAAQDTQPLGIAFNNDGTKLYVVGFDGADINEYNLSTAYDVSTGVFVDRFSVTAQEASPSGMAFNNDGTKLYVVGFADDKINEYNLSPAYDVSSGIFVDSFSVAAQHTTPFGMAFNNDGTKLYVMGFVNRSVNPNVNEYNLSTAYDVSTGVFVDGLSVTAQDTAPTGMAFNNDGTKLYVLGHTGNNVYEYNLSPAYNVSSGVFVDSFNVAAQEGRPQGIVFNNDGTKLYIIGTAGDSIHEYDIAVTSYTETAAENGAVGNSNPIITTLTGGTF